MDFIAKNVKDQLKDHKHSFVYENLVRTGPPLKEGKILERIDERFRVTMNRSFRTAHLV